MFNTKIVILGGGFAGVAAVLGLEKNVKDAQITLVDREAYHQFNSNLYEAATAAEELTNIFDLKKSIALPFAEIFKGKRVNFVQGEVKSVDAENRTVNLGAKKIEYDYIDDNTFCNRLCSYCIRTSY